MRSENSIQVCSTSTTTVGELQRRALPKRALEPSFTEAYLKLGEAQAKLNHKDDARKALGKVVELAPESKEAKEAKKLSAKL